MCMYNYNMYNGYGQVGTWHPASIWAFGPGGVTSVLVESFRHAASETPAVDSRGKKCSCRSYMGHPSINVNVGGGRTLVTDFPTGKKNVEFNIIYIQKLSSRPRDKAGGLDWLRQELPINTYFCLQPEQSRGDNIHRPAAWNTVGDVQTKITMKHLQHYH